MKLENSPSSVSRATLSPAAEVIPQTDSPDSAHIGRRHFLKGLGIAGASLASVTTLLTTSGAEAEEFRRRFRRGLTQGDVDILRFVAAAEILETDLWVQYQEIADNNPAFQAAISVLDADMVQYIDDNTDDENSHQLFLNAFLVSVGAEPVNLDEFRTLQGSHATGSTGKLRLTNLLNLNVDTSWYTRYRSTENPDFGDVLKGPITIMNRPAIPINDIDTPPNVIPPSTHMQAIANTAGFHFATIEQGGSSLYGSLIPMATSLVVLRILYAIGGSEVAHFQTWHDKAGNAPALIDNQPGFNPVTFPNLNSPPFGGEAFQTNLIMPEPCDFISEDLPDCAIIRPTLRKNAGALAVADFLKQMGLFTGQSPQFFSALHALAVAADKARRQIEREGEEE
jgi:hypothetical protein